MPLFAVPLLMSLADPVPRAKIALQTAQASVQIISAEEIRFETIARAPARVSGTATVRQQRVRDGMPIIEFY